MTTGSDNAQSRAPSPPDCVVRPAQETESVLRAWVEGREMPSGLRDAILYSLLGGGKRLRPVVCWHASAAAGDERSAEARGRASLPACAAVELIHAFSLVHDDLPALDNDDLRRGRPTLHRHAGEAMALLAGDGMLTLGFDLLLDEQTYVSGLREAKPLRADLCLELAQGTMGMINGQVYDTLGGFPGGLGDQERLDLVHRNKTGMLLRASCRMGAMVGSTLEGGNPDAIEAVTRYADAIGLMFQIVDDLIDVEQSAEHVGKATGKDQDAGKLTYPGVLGVEASRRAVRELEARAMDAVAPLGASAEPLLEICSYMAVRTK